MLAELGKSIADNVMSELIGSGRFDRMVEDAIACEWEKMATEPKYTLVKDRLLAGAARIRAKQKQHFLERKLAFDNLSWWKRITTNFDEFSK